jgi:hypothetical protein
MPKKTKTRVKKPQNKTCKKFCKKTFLPERERVEKKFSKSYEPIDVLRKNKKNDLANILENMYLQGCDDIYCQKKCKNKSKWTKSINKKRKTKLMDQGAISGCRDLIAEYPNYYKNI